MPCPQAPSFLTEADADALLDELDFLQGQLGKQQQVCPPASRRRPKRGQQGVLPPARAAVQQGVAVPPVAEPATGQRRQGPAQSCFGWLLRPHRLACLPDALLSLPCAAPPPSAAGACSLTVWASFALPHCVCVLRPASLRVHPSPCLPLPQVMEDATRRAAAAEAEAAALRERLLSSASAVTATPPPAVAAVYNSDLERQFSAATAIAAAAEAEAEALAVQNQALQAEVQRLRDEAAAATAAAKAAAAKSELLRAARGRRLGHRSSGHAPQLWGLGGM